MMSVQDARAIREDLDKGRDFCRYSLPTSSGTTCTSSEDRTRPGSGRKSRATRAPCPWPRS
jgi:hypothetical protein